MQEIILIGTTGARGGCEEGRTCMASWKGRVAGRMMMMVV